MEASASAPSPANCAPVTEASPGSAVVSDMGWAFSVPRPPAVLVSAGLRVGNRPEALPPGLSDDNPGAPSADVPVVLRYGRLVAGSTATLGAVLGLVLVPAEALVVPAEAVAAAVTLIETAATGPFEMPVPLPVTVNLTESTDVAVDGTLTCARSSVFVDVESMVPRLVCADPSPLPATVNLGDKLDGVAVSLRAALATLPFSAQTSMSHWAVWPRLMLVSSLFTVMHSAGVAAAAVFTT